ncbi:MAG: hypothetical protein A3F73_00175 [Gallionellales bacterium RIFCSPLOWO2_12_FULL_59_22]|nr:MAG: hypothetical protein A2Z65_10190 [Gallionellales bacterium RIFCSPLOWO2_02_58_13]OGT13589.1 MAG: hypothetical protein A3F73_00175 [Gallionellales bacterium RIFCSPLOWO2_12_FULL_59_22]
MRNILKAQLNNQAITSGQQKLLAAGLKVAGGIFKGGVVLVIFMLLVLVGHYTGFEQGILVLIGVE